MKMPRSPRFSSKRRKSSCRKARTAFSVSFVVATATAAAFFLIPAPPRHASPVDIAPPVHALLAVPGSVDAVNPGSAVTITRLRADGIPLTFVAGGRAETRRSPLREGVPEFVSDAGAQAGLNGTFFADAALAGTDNVVIGPTLCGDEAHLTRGPYDKGALLTGRPLVLLAAGETRIVPYDPIHMDSETALRGLLPGVTDAFLGGVWLVHDGIAADADKVASFGVHDADDLRRRAFFALASDGSPVLGATTDVTSSTHLASALAVAGVQEAILMDSGFSTSLVDNDKILVTGHTAPSLPSRPVPHAIVLFAPGTPPLSPLVRAIVEEKAFAMSSVIPSVAVETRPAPLSRFCAVTLTDIIMSGPRKPDVGSAAKHRLI